MGKTIVSYFNKLLGAVSMYNGMLFGLLSIWVVALLFSFVGILNFSPLAMLSSGAVLAVSTGMASWLIGALFGVRAHGPSSLITALILALIFTPTLELAGLVVLAFIGIIAGASKFILVYKGRHIFNPAAIAAVVIGLTGLTAASWWVATPSLTVFVLAIVLVSLYKTKQYTIVGTFLAVSIPLLLIYFAINDIGILDGIILLQSWPILFLAGVMLIEPLTLPPKKWQLYTEAVIVAVLFAVPLKLGAFELNPAIALVAGNIFAAFVAGRQALTLTFKKRRHLTPTTEEYIFTPTQPVQFEAGQFMELNIPLAKQDLRGERRTFSITSLPEAKEVSFGIKFYSPASAFKQTLQTLKAGAEIRVSNVSGSFVLPKDANKKILLVAGGIGITPFIGQLKWLAHMVEKRDVVLVYAVSDTLEIAYKEELEKLGAKVFIASLKKPTSLAKQWRHIKTDRLTQEQLEEAVPDIAERVSYVSGPPTFVQVTRRNLKRLKAPKVATDSFVGY